MTADDGLVGCLRDETLLTLRPRRYTLAVYVAVAVAFRLLLRLSLSPWVEGLLLAWFASTFPFARLVRSRCTLRGLAVVQLGYFLLELLLLTGVIHLAGLARSFGGVYYLYIIVYAAFFMERAPALAVTAAAALLYSLLVLGEMTGVLRRYPPLGLPVEPEAAVWPLFLGTLLILTAGSTYWLIGYTVNRFAEHLRRGERDLRLLALRQETLETSQRRLEAELAEARRRAVTDGLTGLFNRAFFTDRLAQEVAEAARTGSALSLILLDIDHFKYYNDTFGHLEGDRVLRGCARVLRSLVRPENVVARYGGEEFAVLLPRAGPEEAGRVAERVRAAVEVEWGFRRPVTVSAGVASYPRHAGSAAALLEAADRALYAAKRQGRNRVVVAAEASAPPPA